MRKAANASDPCELPACCRRTGQRSVTLPVILALVTSVSFAACRSADHSSGFHPHLACQTDQAQPGAMPPLDALYRSYRSPGVVPAGGPAGCEGAHPAGHHNLVHLCRHRGGDMPPQQFPSGSRAAHAHHHAGHLARPGGSYPVQRWAQIWVLHRAGFSIGVVHHRPWPTSRTKLGREAAAQLCAQAWCWPIIMQGMCHLLVAKFLFSQNVLLQLQSCLLLLRSSSACLIGPASWQLAKGESWVGGSCVSCAQTSVAQLTCALPCM